MRPLVQTPVQTNDHFTEAVQPFLTGLRSYCRSLTNSLWDGEDLVQETLLKAYKSWTDKKKPLSKAYLFRIASNKWIDQYRKRSLDEECREDLAEFAAEKEASSALFEAMEVLLKELTPKQRAAVLLVEGLAYTAGEAAAWLDSTEGSIKAALHRARRNLKQAHVDHEVDDEEVMPYVQAYLSGETADIVELYRKEIGDMKMSLASHSGSLDHFTTIQSIGASYRILSFRAINGTIWSIPFYQTELSVLLYRLAEERGMAA